jgi:hypothetical protein
MRQQFLYRTTEFHVGSVPLRATRYTPPVRAAKSTWLQTAVVGNGDSGWFSGWPELWRTGNLFRAPPPVDGHGNTYTEDGVAIRRDTLVAIPSTMSVMYYRPGPSAFPGAPPAQYRGKGPYVYLQERLQVHGLPAVLRHGHSIRRGRYTLWTGSFGKGLPWVALERRGIALLVSSNSLTEKDLVRYGFGTLAG